MAPYGRSVPPLTLDAAVDLTRTGDVWLFRGRTAADRAIQLTTNSPVNHVGMSVVLEDMPPLMWHAELGRSLPDVWSGTNHRGVQLHVLRDAVLTWGRRYGQQAWLRQLHLPSVPDGSEVPREMEDALLRTIARLDGTPFPSTAKLAAGWVRGRLPQQATGGRADGGAGAGDRVLRRGGRDQLPGDGAAARGPGAGLVRPGPVLVRRRPAADRRRHARRRDPGRDPTAVGRAPRGDFAKRTNRPLTPIPDASYGACGPRRAPACSTMRKEGHRMTHPAPRSLRVVVAPDKFKGSLTAQQAADAIAAGAQDAADALGLTLEVHRQPVADGGEGIVAAALAAGYRPHQVTVSGPLGDPVDAVLAIGGDHPTASPGGARTAVVELATASGLALLPGGRGDMTSALTAGSRGTGELVRAALDEGVDRIVLGIGGSASTDGGTGLASALGVRFLDSDGAELPPAAARWPTSTASTPPAATAAWTPSRSWSPATSTTRSPATAARQRSSLRRRAPAPTRSRCSSRGSGGSPTSCAATWAPTSRPAQGRVPPAASAPVPWRCSAPGWCRASTSSSTSSDSTRLSREPVWS